MAHDKSLQQKLEENGEFYFRILRKGNEQINYDGHCLSPNKRYVSTILFRADLNIQANSHQSIGDGLCLIHRRTGPIVGQIKTLLKLAA